MTSIVSRATTADGTDLLVRHWPVGGPGAGPPWASVLLVHGLGEHSGRYEHVGGQMAAAGLDVQSFDLRGNGGSGGRRGHLDRWSQFHDDLAERLEAVRLSAAGQPVVLYGHSMGGLIVLGYLLSARPKPDLAVVTAPGLDSTLATWKKRWRRCSAGSCPPWRSRTASTGAPCRAIRRSPRRSPPTRRAPRQAPLGSVPRPSPSRPGSAATAGT